MIRRPARRRRGPRIRRPGALLASLVFAGLAVGVIALSPERLAELPPPLGGGAPAPSPAEAPAQAPAQVPVAPAPSPSDALPAGPGEAPVVLRGQSREPPPAAAPSQAVTVEALPPPKLARAAAPTARPPQPTPPPRPAPAPPAPALSAPAASGGVQVQVGAFASQALAEGAWREVAAMWPDQAAGKRYETVEAQRNGRTVYRARVGGFSSRAEATAFCARLMAASRACFVN